MIHSINKQEEDENGYAKPVLVDEFHHVCSSDARYLPIEDDGIDYLTPIRDLDKRYDPTAISDDVNIPYRDSNTIVNRIFYVDVGCTPVGDIPSYMETVRKLLTMDADGLSSRIKEAQDAGLWEDYFIPIRPKPSTKGFFRQMKEFFFGCDLKESIRQTSHIEIHTIHL